MLHFVSILISYALAGSQAYGNVFGLLPDSSYLVLPFVCLFSPRRLCRRTAAARDHADHVEQGPDSRDHGVCHRRDRQRGAASTFISEWAYVGRPLLIGTVALGGGVNVVPVVLAKVDNSRARDCAAICWRSSPACSSCGFSTCSGATLCCARCRSLAPPASRSTAITSTRCDAARECGNIATIPLIRVCASTIPSTSWIATFIDVFIMLSISISFVTMSLGTRHVLDGVAHDVDRVQGRVGAPPRLPVPQVPVATRRALRAHVGAGLRRRSDSIPRSFLVVMEKVSVARPQPRGRRLHLHDGVDRLPHARLEHQIEYELAAVDVSMCTTSSWATFSLRASTTSRW
jgi:hypothetical protein